MKISGKLFFSVLVGISLTAMSVLAASESTKYLEDANSYYQNYLTTKDAELLEKAYLNYYQASKIEPTASSYLGMGMVFIEKKMYKKAKVNLYRAYSVDENDAITNYYLGLFYFNNEEYLRALEFYKRAHENGLADNYDVNLKIGTIYEKVGDIEKANTYYAAANALNPNSVESQDKLDDINTKDTQTDALSS